MSNLCTAKVFTTGATIEHNGKEIDVEISYLADVYNDGIGEYEYWGIRGYDKGRICTDVTEIQEVIDEETGENIIDELTEEEYDRVREICEENDVTEDLNDMYDYQETEYYEGVMERRMIGD